MSQNRFDTLDHSFMPVKRLEFINGLLFWTSVAISFGIILFDKYSIKTSLNIAFVIVTVAYFAGSNILSLVLLPRAQGNRSTHMIANAFGAALDNEETQNYYNNSQSPSITRLGMIIFENSLFSNRVSSKMLVVKRIKVYGYLLVWLVLLISREVSLDIISVAAQTLFASSLMTDYLKLELSRYQFQTIYKDCWNLFLNNGGQPADLSAGVILDLAVKYESVKSSMSVSLSSKIFHKINADTTQQWERIKQRLSLG